MPPATSAGARAAEVQLGGADVLTDREMMERTAEVLGRRRPLVVKVPVQTRRLSSYWVALVTPVEARLARPLGFDDAVRAAVG